MGQKNSNNSNTKENLESSFSNKKENNTNNKDKVRINLQRNSFDFLYVIGKGGFGKVKSF